MKVRRDLKEELAVLNVLDGLGRCGVEARAVGPSGVGGPAFVRVEGSVAG